MARRILIVGTNNEQCQDLCAILEDERYRAEAVNSLAGMDYIQTRLWHAIILDLDTLEVDNRLVRNLKKARPGLCILLLSSRPFHPELVEAMRKHVYACIRKPLDPEELIYILRSTCV